MRKNGQHKTIYNPRAAGRPKILTKKEREACIYHRSRPILPKDRPVHVTVKFNKSKIGNIRNKLYYQAIRKGFRRLRVHGARLIEYSVQHDHIHLLIEASDSKTLGRAMRSLSISLSKRFSLINNQKVKALKNRYHLHILKTINELKIARNYILNNGKKHLVPDIEDLYFSRSDFTLFNPTEALLEFLDDLKSVLDAPQFWITRKF
jgi:REP element-mobilizing transposase RayT